MPLDFAAGQQKIKWQGAMDEVDDVFECYKFEGFESRILAMASRLLRAGLRGGPPPPPPPKKNIFIMPVLHRFGVLALGEYPLSSEYCSMNQIIGSFFF